MDCYCVAVPTVTQLPVLTSIHVIQNDGLPYKNIKTWTVVVSDIIQHADSCSKNMDCCYCFRHPTKTWTVVVSDIIQHADSCSKNMDCCYCFRHHPTKTWTVVVSDIIQHAGSPYKNMDCCSFRHHPTC